MGVLTELYQSSIALFFPGRMFIFYGNKTSTQFLNFAPSLICSDELQSNILCYLTLLIYSIFFLECRSKITCTGNQGPAEENWRCGCSLHL